MFKLEKIVLNNWPPLASHTTFFVFGMCLTNLLWHPTQPERVKKSGLYYVNKSTFESKQIQFFDKKKKCSLGRGTTLGKFVTIPKYAAADICVAFQKRRLALKPDHKARPCPEFEVTYGRSR